MKREAQEIETIGVGNLLSRVEQHKTGGDRLVAISCAAVEGTYEITYSFEDRDHRFVHLRIVVEPGATIPSDTSNSGTVRHQVHLPSPIRSRSRFCPTPDWARAICH